MSPITWDERFSVGVSRIDEQHRKLIDMINMLDRVVSSGHGRDVLDRMFTGLISYTAIHFREEEQYMRDAGFPGYASHKREHDELTAKAVELGVRFRGGQKEIADEVLKFLRDWFRGHLLGTDMMYVPYLAQLALPVGV